MATETTMEITVHERLDAPGFVVKLAATDGENTRTTKLPVDDLAEAEKLAESLANFVRGGGPLDAIFPEPDSNAVTDAPGTP